jgi:hypothetical protein
MVSGEPVPAWLDNSILPSPTALVSIKTGEAPGIGFLCGGGNGPRAIVTGSSSLTVSRFDCPPGGVNREFVSVAIEGGTGVVSDGVLTLTVGYVVTYYGQAYPVSFVLVGTRSCIGSDCPPLAG